MNAKNFSKIIFTGDDPNELNADSNKPTENETREKEKKFAQKIKCKMARG